MVHSFTRTWLSRLSRGLAVTIAALVAVSLNLAPAWAIKSLEANPWRLIQVPSQTTMLDLAFTSDPNHGWLVGTETALLETNDGGDTWEQRKLELDDDRYRFTGISFSGQEGWVVGEPSILLHTTDGGSSWSRIALSEKLPGTPLGIKALSSDTAEMYTNVAAIYRTTDGGRNWKALVQDAAGVARNISRSEDGRYISVSARGNFYSAWDPGTGAWIIHQRTSSRRLQNMGFGMDGRLWLVARGGGIQFSDEVEQYTWEKPVTPEVGGMGILDLTYRTPEEIWVSGGGGALYMSDDSGKSWKKDKELEGLPTNFYRVIFNGPDQGFVLGNSGVLLKYEPTS
jgi:photosystem II stability/assembly factor-like uncharacterized protein